jgi:hypothetical protein
VTVTTHSVLFAGSTAEVSMVVYGDKATSDVIVINQQGVSLSIGKTTTKIHDLQVDVGKPFKLRVWHDSSETTAAWCLSGVHYVMYVCPASDRHRL